MGFAYFETSAKTGENVASAFENAVKIGHTSKKKLGGRKRMKSEFADSYLNLSHPSVSGSMYSDTFIA